MHKLVNRTLGLIFAVMLTGAMLGCNPSNTAAPGGGSGGAGDENGVAATVNGKQILLKDVDKILSARTGGKQGQMSQIELAAARMQILDGLIQQEVLFQRAEKDKLAPSEDDLTQTINSQKQQQNMTDNDYQKYLQESGLTEQDVREQARRTIAINKMQERVMTKVSIQDRDVEDFYNQNKQQFVNQRGVQLSAIIVSPTDQGMQFDAKNDAEAKAKIDRISAQLKGGGADFATVARAESEDQESVQRGGDLGFVSEEQLKARGFPADLVNRLMSGMKVGDFTEPVQVSGSWIIFKLARRQEQAENLTLESPGVRDQIKSALLQQRQQLLNAALLLTAMNEAKVVNHLANNMMNNPMNMSGARPATAPSPESSPATNTNTAATPSNANAPATASPSATASPAASPRATASPQASRSPGANASPAR